MQPFRDDEDALRARAAELEAELAVLHEKLAELRAPDRGRIEQLELELARERVLLAETRAEIGQPLSSSFLTKDKVGASVLLLGAAILYALLHHC